MKRDPRNPDIVVENQFTPHGIDANRKRIERMVLTAPRPEPIREPEEILLVDRVENPDDGTLEDLILQSGYSQRALPPVRLRNIPSPGGQRAICPSLNLVVQIRDLAIKVCLVGSPGHPIHAGSGLALEGVERLLRASGLM